MPQDDNKMARGLYYSEPRQGAPDYVIAGLSFRRADFIAWLQQQEEDSKGYVKVDILRAKSSGKIYGKLNDWVPSGDSSRKSAPPTRNSDVADDVDNESVPF